MVASIVKTVSLEASVNGNPVYEVTLRDTQGREHTHETLPDAAVGYDVATKVQIGDDLYRFAIDNERISFIRRLDGSFL